MRSAIRCIRRALSGEDNPRADLGLPCAVCGAPAVGWAIASSTRDGVQRIDGHAACATHQREAEELPHSKAG